MREGFKLLLDRNDRPLGVAESLTIKRFQAPNELQQLVTEK
ncbi:hypothetical protein QUA20_09325 [Microcoleus sp. Pol7_A1]